MQSSWPKLGLLVLCVLAPLGAGGRAAADECASARQHLVVARRALQVHDYARAIAEYQTSYEQDGHPLTLLLLARTYAQTGEVASALDLYRDYLDAVPADERTRWVESEIARLSTLALDRRIAIFDDSDSAAFPAVPIVDDGAGALAR